MDEPVVSIIIVNYNYPELLSRCLASIDRHLPDCAKEVIVVDNNSRDECLNELEQRYPYLTVIRSKENIGFGKACNLAVRRASASIVLLLNSDTELIDASLHDAIRRFQTAAGKQLWGFKILWPDGSFQNSFSREITFADFVLSYTLLARLFPHSRRVRRHKYDGIPFSDIAEVDVVYGTAMMLDRDDFLTLGGFSSDFFMYFEDIDFCDRFRTEMGGHVCFYPYVAIIHHVQGSSGSKLMNWPYQKHKYVYGSKKFGLWRMSIFVLLDIPLLLMQYVYHRLFLRR